MTYPSDRDEANHICGSDSRGSKQQAASPRDFAVLYRTNAQSRLLEQALLSRKLKLPIDRRIPILSSAGNQRLAGYLRLVLNSRDDVAFKRVINTPTRGLGDKTIEKVAEIAAMRGVSISND